MHIFVDWHHLCMPLFFQVFCYTERRKRVRGGGTIVVTGQRGLSSVFDFPPGEIKRRIHQMWMLRTQKLECLCRAPGLRANALTLLGSRGRLQPKSTWAETPSDWCCGNSWNHLAGKPPDSSPSNRMTREMGSRKALSGSLFSWSQKKYFLSLETVNRSAQPWSQ